MTAPQHAASRRWLVELLDWLLSVAATLASRLHPQTPAAVPVGVPDAPATPQAGAPSPVPALPPGPGASPDDTVPLRRVRGQHPYDAPADVGALIARLLPAQRTPTAPNPVYRPLPLVRPWLVVLVDPETGGERYRMADAGQYLRDRDAARSATG